MSSSGWLSFKTFMNRANNGNFHQISDKYFIVADIDLYFKTFPWQRLTECGADRDISSFKWLLTNVSGFELIDRDISSFKSFESNGFWQICQVLNWWRAGGWRGSRSKHLLVFPVDSVLMHLHKKCVKTFSKGFFQTLIPFLLEDLKGQLEHWKPRDIVWVFIPPPLELSSWG